MIPTASELVLMEAINHDPMYKASDPQERALLSGLYRRKLVKDIFTRPGRKLTPEGLRLLLSAQEAVEKAEQERTRQQADADAAKAEERAHLDQQTKKQFRHDWRIAIFELIGGFVLGSVADHFFDVVGNASRTVIAALTALGLIH